MSDTPIGTPIPIGVIDTHEMPPPAVPSPDHPPQESRLGRMLATDMRTTDALMLAPLKIGLAMMLAGAALACNPFCAGTLVGAKAN